MKTIFIGLLSLLALPLAQADTGISGCLDHTFAHVFTTIARWEYDPRRTVIKVSSEGGYFEHGITTRTTLLARLTGREKDEDFILNNLTIDFRNNECPVTVSHTKQTFHCQGAAVSNLSGVASSRESDIIGDEHLEKALRLRVEADLKITTWRKNGETRVSVEGMVSDPRLAPGIRLYAFGICRRP